MNDRRFARLVMAVGVLGIALNTVVIVCGNLLPGLVGLVASVVAVALAAIWLDDPGSFHHPGGGGPW